MCYDHYEESKREFLDWLHSFDAVSDEERLLDELVECGDFLPDAVCMQLDIPLHSAYCDAAKLFRSEWSPT